MRYLIRMSELDDRGILLNCPKCGRRNRMRYEGLGQTFHCAQCKNDLPALNQPVDARSDLAFDALISRAKLPVLVDFGRHGAALAKWLRRSSGKWRRKRPVNLFW